LKEGLNERKIVNIFVLNTWMINSAIISFHLPTELYFTNRMHTAVSLVTDRGTEWWRW